MLATGGTMVQALADIVARGASASNIRVVAVVAAPPALKKLADLYPGGDHAAHDALPGGQCLQQLHGLQAGIAKRLHAVTVECNA